MISGLAEWRPYPLSGRDIARIHSITSIAAQRLADALLQPMTLLAAVVWLFNGSWVDIAILTVVASASSALGSTVMPYALRYVEDIRLVILGANVVRAGAAALIVVLGWRIVAFRSADFVSLLIIGILFLEIGSAVNISTNPRSTIANIDQPTSMRARQVAGAMAGLIGGLAAWRALGTGDPGFPRSIGWLLALGGMASIVAVWFQITAPIRRNTLRHKPELVRIEHLRSLLATGNMRRFLIFRLLFGLADLADPFLIVYGMIEMRLGLVYVGLIILVLALSQIIGGITWTVVREARGSRRSMQLAAMLRFTGLILAAGVPMIARSEAWQHRFDSGDLGSWLFVLAFFFIGLGQSTYLRNEQAYARRIAVDERLYPAALMLTNASLLITAIAALIGVWIIEASSLEMALVSASVLAFIALLASGVLVGPRTLRRRKLSPGLRGPRKPIRVRKPRRPRTRRPRT